jgi:hypothetical protein
MLAPSTELQGVASGEQTRSQEEHSTAALRKETRYFCYNLATTVYLI